MGTRPVPRLESIESAYGKNYLWKTEKKREE